MGSNVSKHFTAQFPFEFWISTHFFARSKITEEDPTNRFAIGEAFLVKKENNTETVIVPESVLLSVPPPPPPPPLETFPDHDVRDHEPAEKSDDANLFDMSQDDFNEKPSTPSPPPPIKPACEVAHIQTVKVPADLTKYCEICDISVTSEMHMRLHLSGAKHAKKLRQLGEPPYTEAPHSLMSQCISEEAPAPRPKPNAIEGIASGIDFSVFRTPSGHYYCQVCDLSVTSETTLSQHFASKRHLKTAKKK